MTLFACRVEGKPVRRQARKHRGKTDNPAALAQLDSVVHFTTALALSAAFTQVRGARWTVPRLLAIVLLWEAIEAFVMGYISPRIFSQPSREGLLDLVYLYDTLDDIALGVAGTLVGAYFKE